MASCKLGYHTNGKPSKGDRKRKMSTCSFRLDSQLKERLQAIARRQGRTLSSLIDRVLRDFLSSQRENLPENAIKREKRRHPRKEIILPARWRLKQKENVVEYDVILRNISAGGAYTEYVNGQNIEISSYLQVSPLGLIVRMPGAQKPAALDCKVIRTHITRGSVGVGLSFTKVFDEDSL